MAEFGFCGAAYTLQSPNVDAEALFNAYCEAPESGGAKSAMTLMHRPGLKTVYTLAGENSIPYEFAVNGRAFVAGAYFWEVFANGTSTKWGTLNGPPLSPTQIFSCQTHLLILSNGDLFIFVLVPVTDSMGVLHPANSFIVVDMSQFNGPVQQIDFCDGYFFATIQNSNTFQVSDLEDGTTWNGLFISTISYFPDNIVSMKVDHREVWFFSGKKTIGYYNAGAGFPPFIPIQGAFLEDGCAATFGTSQVNNTVAWIAQDERGFGSAKIMGGGYVGQRISTLAIEFAWQSYPTIADAVSYTYQIQGHTFWEIRFPTANVTWGYDFLTGLWYQNGFWNVNTATYSQHRVTSHMFAFGMHLVGDPQSGNINQMSIDIYQDFGNIIRGMRRSPTISAENSWIYFSEIEFDIEVGLAPSVPLFDGDGQSRAPYVMLRWSNDATKTWSNTYYLSLGMTGEYNKRVRKTQLGRARKRVWELSWTDPVAMRIANAYLEATSEGKPIYTRSERLSDQYRKIA